jgi:hypothetical protein
MIRRLLWLFRFYRRRVILARLAEVSGGRA